MRRLFATALLIGLLATLGACDLSDPCGPFDNTFEVTGFATEALEVERLGDSLSTTPRLNPIENDTVAYNRFAIRMRAQMNTYVSSADTSNAGPWPSLPRLIAPAYACSPPLLSSDDVIRDIQIYSDQAFDAAHPAGTDLAELFDVIAFYPRSGYERAGLDAFVAGAPHAAEEIIFVLKSAPQNASRFRFTVKYFQEGRALDDYEFETKAVTIEPN